MSQSLPAAGLLAHVRHLTDSGQHGVASDLLRSAAASDVAASRPYDLLATWAGLEAGRGHRFRAFRLAGAAAAQPRVGDSAEAALRGWLATRLVAACSTMSDDSSSTEWLWGNRLTTDRALTFAQG